MKDEAQLSSSNQVQVWQFEAIIEAMTDAVFVLDAVGNPLLTNSAARTLLTRILPSDYIERSLAEQFTQIVLSDENGQPLPLEAWPASRILAGEVLAPEKAAELSMPTRDGRLLYTHMTGGPLYDTTGAVIGAVIVVRDVTEGKRAEQERERYTQQLRMLAHREREAREEVETQKELLQLILDELPSSVYLVRGADARLMLANRTAETLWGASWPYNQAMQTFLVENDIQLYSSTGLPLPPEQWVTLRAVRQLETIRQHQETIHRPNGSDLPVLVNAVALGTTTGLSRLPGQFAGEASQEGEPLALVVHHDVAALKEAEYIKDEFIGIAAHELRNPVAALAGFAEMLKIQTARGKGQALDDWQLEALDEIEQASKRLIKLTGELLDITSLQAGRLQLQCMTTDLVALAQRIVTRLQATTERSHLSLQTSSAQIMVFIDPVRIEQVLSNLLNNAIKYSPSGGPITAYIQQQQQQILISVQDNGMGIPQSQHTKIFSRFMRADNVREAGISGTGLGLYLCRELIELHEGRIWFESEEGIGTTFFFTLPYATAAKGVG